MNNKKNESKIIKEGQETMPLTKKNFIGIAMSVFMIVLGFLLMLGDSSSMEAYNPDIFSTRRIVVGPFIAFVGFVTMAIAIVWRPSSRK